MKLVTYNIQSGRDAWGQLHLDKTAEAIKALAPDICGLNEVRVGCSDSGNVDQLQYLCEQTGLTGCFAPAIPMAGGQYGIGLLSKYPIVSFDVHKVPDVPLEEREPGYYENRVIYRAVLKTDLGALAVYGTHFGLTRPERRYAVKLAKELISAETEQNLVFMGDLNAYPQDETIKALEEVMHNTHSGERPVFTHHALKLDKTIDYIFTKGNLHSTAAKTSYTVASDHLPLWVELSK